MSTALFRCIKLFHYFQIFAVQHVDVCMFSNGKFKNVVADINESHEIRPGELHRKVYSLLPIKGKISENEFPLSRDNFFHLFLKVQLKTG